MENDNLRSQYERIEIQLKGMQQKYASSEKDKDAMESYYDQKWATEFNHVKLRLEKKYTDRIRQVETDTETKLESMRVRVEYANHQLEQTVKRNKKLEIKYEEDRT